MTKEEVAKVLAVIAYVAVEYSGTLVKVDLLIRFMYLSKRQKVRAMCTKNVSFFFFVYCQLNTVQYSTCFDYHKN